MKENKQLAVAWIMGILLSILLFKGLGEYYSGFLFGKVYLSGWKPTVWSYLAIILIIGGLLIYTLKDKKK